MYCEARDCAASAMPPFPRRTGTFARFLTCHACRTIPFCLLPVLLPVVLSMCGARFASMRASGAAKRSCTLFVQRAPIEPSSAIAQGSGTVCAVGRRFQTKGRRAFQGRIEAYARFAGHARAFPVKRRIQRKNHRLQNAIGEISGTKTINALTLTSS